MFFLYKPQLDMAKQIWQWEYSTIFKAGTLAFWLQQQQTWPQASTKMALLHIKLLDCL